MESVHERFFGIVRSDGSLKPHANVIQRFARTNPKIREPKKVLQIDANEFYSDVVKNSTSTMNSLFQ